jgi:hypothetical protein
VVVSTRPRFAQRLGLVRHIQLERLNPTAVQAFVAAALADDAAASAALGRRMADHPSLLEAMCTPVLMHMAIEAQRGGAAGDSGSGDTASGGGGGVVVGLYQRMEQRFVQQLVRRCGVTTDSASDVWARCSRLAARVALAGCAAGSAVVAWPADAVSQRELLTGVRLLDVLASGEVEFAHRSWQEWFAARAVTADLAAGLDLSPAAVAALRRPENNMLRRFVLALADSAASADKAVAALWDGSTGTAATDFSPAALQPLAEAVVGCPHAPKLAVRGAFAAKAAGVCAAVRTPPHARDSLFDNGAFWVVADAVTGGEQTAWAVDRVAHFAASLWVGKSPVPALAGLDVLAHVQPRSDAVAKCLRAAAGVWNAEVRVKATLQLLVSGVAGAAGKDVLVRTVVDASGDVALRLVAWGRLVHSHGGEPFVADVGSTVLCQRGCPMPLAVAVASSLPAASLVSEALEACAALPGLSDRARRDVLAERLMWRRGLDPAALRYDGSWTLQHVAACTGQLQLLPSAAELAKQPVVTTSHGWTLLHCAVAGSFRESAVLLASDRRLHAQDSAGIAPVMQAARSSSAVILKACLVGVDSASVAHLWQAVVQRRSLPHAEALVSALGKVQLRGCEWVSDDVIAWLPASVEELNVSGCVSLTGGVRFGHLARLRKLGVDGVPRVTDGVVASLPGSVEELDVSGCESLTGGVRFSHLPRLRKLAVGRVAGVTDDVVASLPGSVEELGVSGCWRLTDGVRFSHLPRLRKLDVSSVPGVTDGVVASLPGGVEELDVSGCTSLTRDVRFGHLPRLRKLAVGRVAGVTDGVVASLPGGVEELDVSGCTSLTGGVRFGHLPRLRKLDVHDVSGVTNVVVVSLPGSVEELDVSGCKSLRGDVRFGHLLRLRKLDVHHVSGVLDDVVASLPGSVEELDVSGCKVLTGDVRFGHLPRLRKLAVGGVPGVTDDVVASLPGSVEELNVGECESLRGDVRFGHLPRLRKLDVGGVPGVTDDVVASLPGSVEELDVSGYRSLTGGVRFDHLARLRTLDVSYVRGVTDDVVASLPGSVEELDVSGCKSLTGGVRFSHLPRLRKLDVHDVRGVTDGVVASLPDSVEELDVWGCKSLTGGMRFGHLPRLRKLGVRDVLGVTDGVVASLPGSVEELNVRECTSLTGGVRFGHLPRLRLIKASDAVWEANKAVLEARGVFCLRF